MQREALEGEVENLLGYIYDNLGEETLSRWYSSFLHEENGANNPSPAGKLLADNRFDTVRN